MVQQQSKPFTFSILQCARTKPEVFLHFVEGILKRDLLENTKQELIQLVDELPLDASFFGFLNERKAFEDRHKDVTEVIALEIEENVLSVFNASHQIGNPT